MLEFLKFQYLCHLQMSLANSKQVDKPNTFLLIPVIIYNEIFVRAISMITEIEFKVIVYKNIENQRERECQCCLLSDIVSYIVLVDFSSSFAIK